MSSGRKKLKRDAQFEKLPVRPLSLRFKNSQMEEGFATARKPVLMRRTRWLSCLHILANVSTLLIIVVTQGYQREHMLTDVAYLCAMLQAAMHTFLIFINCLLLILFSGRCVRHLNTVRPFVLESVVVGTIIACMYTTVLSSQTRMAKLHGYALTEAFGVETYDSDSTVLLTIDIFVTATHLGLPIRWHVIAPLEIAAILLYAGIIVAVGSEEPMVHVIFNLVVLTTLVIAAACGKRLVELDERRAFLCMINEKALRCEAEFKLAQTGETAEETDHGPAMTRVRSEPKSELTNKSATVFESLFEKNVDQTEQLEQVASMGDSEHWRIAASEVKLLPEEDSALGRGSFGTVQKAVFCGMLVAVKSPRLDLSNTKIPDLCNELRVLRHLRHPNIVTAHGAVILPDEKQLLLVLELIDGVNLTTFLLPPESALPEVTERYCIMMGVCRALLYMHTRVPQIVHGDLKGTNIMVECWKKGCPFPKVLDFGLSRVISRRTRALGGTLAWVAPEVVDKAPVHCSADIYSFGRILAFAATSIPPMRKMNHAMILRALLKKKPPLPQWPDGCHFSPTCKPLVEACLHPKPDRRPSIKQVHSALLGLSNELGLVENQGSFIQQVRKIAEQWDQEFSYDMAGSMPMQGLSVQKMTSAEGKLPSLPEEEILTTAQNLSDISESPAMASTSTTSLHVGSHHTERMERRDRRRGRRVPFPELLETSHSAMESTLMATFKRWNTSKLGKSCCERHVWFKLAQEVCARAMTSGCVMSSCHPKGCQPPAQCSNCGVLGIVGDTCDLCGWEEGDSEASILTCRELHMSL